jgi:hypothetical protein
MIDRQQLMKTREQIANATLTGNGSMEALSRAGGTMIMHSHPQQPVSFISDPAIPEPVQGDAAGARGRSARAWPRATARSP